MIKIRTFSKHFNRLIPSITGITVITLTGITTHRESFRNVIKSNRN